MYIYETLPEYYIIPSPLKTTNLKRIKSNVFHSMPYWDFGLGGELV